MKASRARIVFGLLLVAAASAAGQQAKQPEVGMKPPPAEEPLDIWQIDLNPSGTGFALTTPVLQGDEYVFKVWPDRAVIHLKKSRVKKMARRTRDVSKEVIYQIDLLPTGQAFSRDIPHERGNNIEYKTWHQGTLVSIKKADVKKISKVAGMDAFKIHLQLLGAKAIGNLAMEGGGNVTVISEAPAPPSREPVDPNGYNGSWIFNGVPGVTEAWAPPSAVIASPGDVPRARGSH
jgi:hypothetical protein